MGALLRLVDAMTDALLRGLTTVLPRLPQDERDPRDVQGAVERPRRRRPASPSGPDRSPTDDQ